MYLGMRFSNAPLEPTPGARAAPAVVLIGKFPSLSVANIFIAVAICFMLLSESAIRPFFCAAENTGSAKPARMAMMEMTTSSSMSVKPWLRSERMFRVVFMVLFVGFWFATAQRRSRLFFCLLFFCLGLGDAREHSPAW